MPLQNWTDEMRLVAEQTEPGSRDRVVRARALVASMWAKSVFHVAVRRRLSGSPTGDEVQEVVQDSAVLVMDWFVSKLTLEVLELKALSATSIVDGLVRNAISAHHLHAEAASPTQVRRSQTWARGVRYLTETLGRTPTKDEVVDYLNETAVRPGKDQAFDGQNHVVRKATPLPDGDDEPTERQLRVPSAEDQAIPVLSASQVLAELSSIVWQMTADDTYVSVLRTWAQGVSEGSIAPNSPTDLAQAMNISRAVAARHMRTISAAVAQYRQQQTDLQDA